MKYGQELLNQLEQELASLRKSQSDREDNIANCEYDSSDAFLSIWANNECQSRTERKINILKNKGLQTFRVLSDLEGNIVSDRAIQTRYGYAYKTPTGWVSCSIRPETMAKKGYKEIEIQKPAWISKEGKTFPSDINFWTGEEVK